MPGLSHERTVAVKLDSKTKPKPAKKKPNMQDTPISYYKSLERRMTKAEEAIKELRKAIGVVLVGET